MHQLLRARWSAVQYQLKMGTSPRLAICRGAALAAYTLPYGSSLLITAVAASSLRAGCAASARASAASTPVEESATQRPMTQQQQLGTGSCIRPTTAHKYHLGRAISLASHKPSTHQTMGVHRARLASRSRSSCSHHPEQRPTVHQRGQCRVIASVLRQPQFQANMRPFAKWQWIVRA